MLKELYIKNLAIIDEEKIVFENGLNVLSGETGAGKSIVFDGLLFALGGKVDKNLIKTSENKLEVSAFFNNLSESESQAIADILGEIIDEILVYRSLNTEGKTENKINGRSVPVAVIKQIGEILTDIISQHESNKLALESWQAASLDEYCSNQLAPLKTQLSEELLKLNEIKKQIDNLGGDENKRNQMIDYLKYQIDEIEKANLNESEEETLSSQKSVMQNSSKINEHLNLSIFAISGSENKLGASGSLAVAIANLSKITEHNETIKNITERLKQTKIEIDDCYIDLENIDIPAYSEKELDKILNRLDEIKALKRKYGSDIPTILDFLNKTKTQLQNLQNCEELLSNLNKKKEVILSNMQLIANEMTKIRKENALIIEQKLSPHLDELNMKGAQFKICFLVPKQINKNGQDNISFYFSANVGEEIKPLSKIASGGELSRLTLAIKQVLISDGASVNIFDEIDSGISGQTGQVLAIKLAKISKTKQVILVSHLAQVAAIADNNLLISKTTNGFKTTSNVIKLNNEGKVLEIMRLLSGTVSVNASIYADELINKQNLIKKQI